MKMFLTVIVLVGSFLAALPAHTAEAKLGNKALRLLISKGEGQLLQDYQVNKNGEWLTLFSSELAKTNSPKLYDTKINAGLRKLPNMIFDSIQQTDDRTIVLQGKDDNAQYKQTISFDPKVGQFRVKVDVQFNSDKPKLEYAISNFKWTLDAKADFVHAPIIKWHDEKEMMGDRTFFSPAVILRSQDLYGALVPNLELINENQVLASGARVSRAGKRFLVPFDNKTQATMPTALDFQFTGEKEAVLSYGYIDMIGVHHMKWIHEPHLIRTLESNKLTYGYDLILGRSKDRAKAVHKVTSHLWKQNGHQTIKKPLPLVMPYEGYAQLCFTAAAQFEDSFFEGEENGLKIGGYRNNPGKWKNFIGNTVWWNNVRDAIGLARWSKMTAGKNLMADYKGQKREVSALFQDWSERMINLALSAPQNQGAFPTIYDMHRKKWINSHWHLPEQGYNPALSRWYFSANSSTYQTASMSKTAAYLLRYYRQVKQDERVIKFLRPYAEFVMKNMTPEGFLPEWFSKDLKPHDNLYKNSNGGAHIWFLSELYMVTKDQRYLAAAKKFANYMDKHTIPQQEWLDFECLHSCSKKASTFKDTLTRQPLRNTLSMFWGVEGFMSLAEATKDKKYLKIATEVAEYASFTQAVWDPHYIFTSYPFGGASSQNSDAEWLDARQGEMAPLFFRLGLLTKRQEYLERGVAAARSSLALVNHPISVQNKIYEHPNFPLGLGPENIDHEGCPQSPMRTAAGWGEVSGLSGIAEILDLSADVYIDVKNRLKIGTGSVDIAKLKNKNGQLQISLRDRTQQLKVKGEAMTSIRIKIKGSNKTPSVTLDGKRLSVRKDGKFFIAEVR